MSDDKGGNGLQGIADLKYEIEK